MASVDAIRCGVFDFAFTLCSQKYFHRLGPRWEEEVDRLLFGENRPDWADPWMTGRITSKQVCRYLSERLPFSADALEEVLRAGCADLRINTGVWHLAAAMRRRGIALSLVTLNMDCFSEIVIGALGLDEAFDVIVNSADEGAIDKARLWELAFERLGNGASYAGSLLIDDAVANVERFRSLGGSAILYIDDDALAEELTGGGWAKILG